MFLDKFLFDYGSPIVICESFSLRSDIDNSALVAPRVIGVVEEWCRQKDNELVFQTPAQAKFYFTDTHLIHRGFLDKSQDHAMDALRHMLYYRRDFI